MPNIDIDRINLDTHCINSRFEVTPKYSKTLRKVLTVITFGLYAQYVKRDTLRLAQKIAAIANESLAATAQDFTPERLLLLAELLGAKLKNTRHKEAYAILKEARKVLAKNVDAPPIGITPAIEENPIEGAEMTGYAAPQESLYPFESSSAGAKDTVPLKEYRHLESAFKKLSSENQKVKGHLKQIKTAYMQASHTLEEQASEREQLEKRLQGETQQYLILQKEAEALKERMKQLHPLPPKYQPLPEDPQSIAGAFEARRTEYAKRFNGISEMTALVEKAIECASQDLLTIADPYNYDDLSHPSGKPASAKQYHLNTSSQIAYAPELEAHRTAIACYAILTLLDGAALKTAADEAICHGDPKIYFNDQDLYLQDSMPLSIPLEENKPPKIVFQHPSTWAAEPDHQQYPEGISPVAAKIVLSKLTPQERTHLFHLIMDPFMELDPSLKEAYKYRDQKNESGKLLTVAYDMIHTMACALKQNYKSKIGHKLMEVFDDDRTEPFIRPDNAGYIPPQKKKELPAWDPCWSVFPEEMVDAALQRWEHLAILYKYLSADIYESVSKNIHKFPILTAHYREELKPYFRFRHNFLHNSCRIDNIATLIYQHTPSKLESRSILLLIVNFLKNPENKAKFEDKILKKGFTVAQIIESYEKNNKSLIEDELEIELAAHALGISIGVFSQGVPYAFNEFGFPEPPIFYGPETKEKFYMLNHPGNTFFALEPRWKLPKAASKELKEALNSTNQSWADSWMDHERQVIQFQQFQQQMQQMNGGQPLNPQMLAALWQQHMQQQLGMHPPQNQ